MVVMTDNARAAIRSLTDQPELPAESGLRIATDSTSGSLSLSLAPSPVEGDAVLDESGARLFLDPQASVLLDDKALDANRDAEGRVQFAVKDQTG